MNPSRSKSFDSINRVWSYLS